MSGGQISYDLRRLRVHQIIERIPHSRSYQVTEDGLSTALHFHAAAERKGANPASTRKARNPDDRSKNWSR
jgi:hypothetical protein